MNQPSEFWISIPLEEDASEVPAEMIAETDSGLFKLVMPYNEERRAREDFTIAKGKSQSPFALLHFDGRERVFKVIEKKPPLIIAKGER